MRRPFRAGAATLLSPAVALLTVLVVPTLAPPARATTFEERLAACLACHGASGQSSLPDTPSLGGQPAFFVTAQLVLFRGGRRDNAAMTEVAKTLTDDDLRAFAAAIARLPPPGPPPEPADAARVARARTLALEHRCVACHGPDFAGREQLPRLAGQREDYLLKAMREYKRGARIGWGGAMSEELVPLGDADLADLAHYLSRFAPAG